MLEELTKAIPLRLDEDEGKPKFGDHILTKGGDTQPSNRKVTTSTPAPRKITATTISSGPNDDEFTTHKTRKDKKAQKKQDDSESDEGLNTKPPLYLGISLHEDAKLMVKLRDMIPTYLRKLIDHFDGQVLKETVNSIEQVWH